MHEHRKDPDWYIDIVIFNAGVGELRGGGEAAVATYGQEFSLDQYAVRGGFTFGEWHMGDETKITSSDV